MHWLALKWSFTVRGVTFLACMIGLGSRLLLHYVCQGGKSGDFCFTSVQFFGLNYVCIGHNLQCSMHVCKPFIRVAHFGAASSNQQNMLDIFHAFEMQEQLCSK